MKDLEPSLHLITSESKYFSSARQKGATSNFKNSKEIVEEHDDWAYGYCSNMNFPENPVDKKIKIKIKKKNHLEYERERVSYQEGGVRGYIRRNR